MTNMIEIRSNGRKCCPECGSDTCCGSIHCLEHDEIFREKELEERAYAKGKADATDDCIRLVKLGYSIGALEMQLKKFKKAGEKRWDGK